MSTDQLNAYAFTAVRDLGSTTPIKVWYMVYNDYYTHKKTIIKIVLRLF